MTYKKLFMNTDGGSRGNPGRAAIGIIISDKNRKLITTHKEFIGQTTNNIAEYKALIKGLEIASSLTNGEVNCFLDSELVVKQSNSIYKVKSSHLKAFHSRVKDIEKLFSKVNYSFVSREDVYQQQADKLVNEALDKQKV